MSALLNDRAVIAVSGSDARDFLQGLITNDVQQVTASSPRYAALLTPQGKVLFDFLIFEWDGSLLLDCAASMREALVKRLSLYRLRAKVEIKPRDDLTVAWQRDGDLAPPFVRDPRHPGLGSRAILPRSEMLGQDGSAEHAALRFSCGVPEAGDFGQDKVFALDAGLEELGGVSFDKGCYVGQELTARMKHRGTARKRLLPVAGEKGEALPSSGASLTAEDHDIGTLNSVHGDRGFALIRLDRLRESEGKELRAGDVVISVMKPEWLFT